VLSLAIVQMIRGKALGFEESDRIRDELGARGEDGQTMPAASPTRILTPPFIDFDGVLRRSERCLAEPGLAMSSSPDTHFEPSFIEFDGILRRSERCLAGPGPGRGADGRREPGVAALADSGGERVSRQPFHLLSV